MVSSETPYSSARTHEARLLAVTHQYAHCLAPSVVMEVDVAVIELADEDERHNCIYTVSRLSPTREIECLYAHNFSRV